MGLVSKEFAKYLKSKGFSDEFVEKIANHAHIVTGRPVGHRQYLLTGALKNEKDDFVTMRELLDSTKKYREEVETTLAVMQFLAAIGL